jgi:predicted dithiol-disulfide oxidoreductase (DUF899 family)
VSAAEWQRASDELLAAEKEATRTLDDIAARRRRLPMVRFENKYEFEGPEGKKTLWATISNMPPAQIEAYKAGKGWTMPFLSSRGTTFAADCGADYFMLSMFLRDGTDIYRTYSTTSRGIDRLLFVNNILDLAVYGRQQDWEDSPPGWPQHPTYG